MAIITISRLLASGGEDIANRLAKELGFTLIDQGFLREQFRSYEVPGLHLDEIDEKIPEGIQKADDQRRLYIDLVRTIIADMALERDIIVLGRGGTFLFKGFSSALHIKILASWESRIKRLCERLNVDEARAASLLEESDRHRREYIRYLYGEDWMDFKFYDLILNTDSWTQESAVKLILQATELKEIRFKKKETSEELEKLRFNSKLHLAKFLTGKKPSHRKTVFANPSEEEFARLLDFYQIRWEYEPKTFPLSWDEQGNVVTAFTPDFYLPDLDLYIELTTMKQQLVTRKNRKIRKLRELYPHINIKIFYEKDYQQLFYKYGLSRGVKKEEGPK
ncbi:MAG TPA: cytidylate kinase family protein [Candidatus Limnocylindrales bacterium]|nr:cytidylate kinase family protein [Candidatus Limnocylindrales bacterium]